MAQADVATSPGFDLEKEKFVLVAKDLTDILGLECNICKEEYVMPKKPPKLLPCSHTFCLGCLKGMGSSQCPICRINHGRFDADNLPTDFKVVSALDAIKKASDAFKNVCIKHNCQSLDRFCALCILPVCNDCVKLCHDEEEGHVIMEMEKALKENASRFEDLENKCEEFLNRLEKRQEVTNNVKDNLDMKERELTHSVELKFNEYCALLVERKERLIASIEGKIKKRKETLDLESNSLQKIRNTVKWLYDSFRASKGRQDIKEMFALQKQFIKDENELVRDFSNEELCDSYDFKTLNEECFKKNLTTLGNLHTKLDVQMILPPTRDPNDEDSDADSEDSNPL